MRPLGPLLPARSLVSRGLRTPLTRRFTTLGIETSCDDTCVAILRTSPHSPRAELLANKKVTSDHRQFRGVYPAAAIQGHASTLAGLVRETCLEAGVGNGGRGGTTKVDLVAVTRGPGMGTLAEGLSCAKGLAVAWDLPIVGVNHMQAHALTPRLVNALEKGKEGDTTISPEYPFLTLLVSGGHTQLVQTLNLTSHRILVNAPTVAIGDCLDKCARLILPPEILSASPDVMYGRALESFAFPEPTSLDEHVYDPPRKRGEDKEPHVSRGGWIFTPPMATTRRLEYDFSNLLSHVMRLLKEKPDISTSERRVLAADVMELAFEHLVNRIILCVEEDPSLRARVKTLVVSGGVAANRFLVRVLAEVLAVRGLGHWKIVAPPLHLCTDNAAMIAWTGWEMYRAGWESGLDVTAMKRWSVDEGVEGGILGASGWVRRQRMLLKEGS